MHVLAVVVVSGPHALEPLAGVPLVVHSVRAALGVPGIGRTVVVAPREHVRAVARECAGDPVTVHVGTIPSVHPVAHAGQRPGGAEGDAGLTSGAADVVLVLDAVRPLVPVTLVERVLGAVRAGHRAVVPVLPLTDTVKLVDGTGAVIGTPDRAGLRVVQTPQGFAPPPGPTRPGPAWLDPVLAAAAVDPAHAWSGVAGPVHAVEGDPLAFPVLDAWQRDLADAAVAAPAPDVRNAT